MELYPIEQTDIVVVGQGEHFTAPKDGAFLSKEYIERVAKARIKNK